MSVSTFFTRALENATPTATTLRGIAKEGFQEAVRELITGVTTTGIILGGVAVVYGVCQAGSFTSRKIASYRRRHHYHVYSDSEGAAPFQQTVYPPANVAPVMDASAA